MGHDICNCLNDRNEYNANLTQHNLLETQINQTNNTKVLYLDSVASNNNYSKSNRQKLLLNSINYTNYDTTINQFNPNENKTIPSLLTTLTKQENTTVVNYLDHKILTKYIENVDLINKIIAVYRGHNLRIKYTNKLLDSLISFEQKLIFKYNRKILNDNPNLEKSINKFGEKILNYQDIWKKYYGTKPLINNSIDLNEKKFGRKIMKYNKKINNSKYKNDHYYKIDENNKSHLKQISTDDQIDYLIENIKNFYDGETDAIDHKIKNGFGVLLQSNGEKKVGTWNYNKFEGWNYYIDINGTLYIGFFVNNKLNGKGEKYNLDDEIYEGDFLDNLEDGFGKEINNMFEYEGEFKKGKKEGKGKIIYKQNGDWYEGDFSNNNFNGNGHYFWKKTGYEYIGNYINGVMEGKGIFKYGDKAIYKGEFKNGKKEGKGEWTTKNNKIVGNFENDLPHGMGYLEDNKGFKGYVQFNEGKIINIK